MKAREEPSTRSVLKTLEVIWPLIQREPRRQGELLQAVRQKAHGMTRQALSYQLEQLERIGVIKRLSNGAYAKAQWEDWDELIVTAVKNWKTPYLYVEEVAKKLAPKLDRSPEDQKLRDRIHVIALRILEESRKPESKSRVSFYDVYLKAEDLQV